jgi:hypothetical protein
MPNRRIITDEQIEKCRAMRMEGRGFTEISSLVGCSRWQAQYYGASVSIDAGLVIHRGPRSVRCSVCNAMVGEGCRTSRGRAASPHLARAQEARRANRAAATETSAKLMGPEERAMALLARPFDDTEAMVRRMRAGR